jgi:general secretion pathway protein L
VSDRNILDADVSELGAWLRQGLDWWLRELRRTLPSWLLPTQGSRLVAEVLPDNRVEYRRGRKTVTRPSNPRSAWLAVSLSDDQILTRSISMPAMSLSDAEKVLEFDLDRWMPFERDRVFLTVRAGDRIEGTGLQYFLVSVLPKSTAEQALAMARQAGLDPYGIAVRADADTELLFATDERLASQRRIALVAWGCVGAFLALNLGLLVYRDMADIGNLRQISEEQAPMARSAMALRSRTEAEIKRRQEILSGNQVQDPIAALDAVTLALPNSVWVQKFEWNAKLIRISGYQNAGFDLASALRGSPLLTSPRLNDPDNLPVALTARVPFDATAKIARDGGS